MARTIEELYGPNVGLDQGGFPISTPGGSGFSGAGAGRSWTYDRDAPLTIIEPPKVVPPPPDFDPFLTRPKAPPEDRFGEWLEGAKQTTANHPLTQKFIDVGGPRTMAMLSAGLMGGPMAAGAVGIGWNTTEYLANAGNIQEDPKGLEKTITKTAIQFPFDVMPGTHLIPGYSAVGEVAKRLAVRGTEAVAMNWGQQQGEKLSNTLWDKRPLREALLTQEEALTGAKFAFALGVGFSGVFEAPGAVHDARVNRAGRDPRRWNLERKQFGEEIAELSHQHGGATYNPTRGGNMAGHRRFAVSIFPERSLDVVGPKEDLKPEVIANYIARNQDILSKGKGRLGVGTWWHEGRGAWVLDIVATPRSKAHAIYLGRKYNQEAIFNLHKMEEIPTGGDGKPIKIDEAEALADATMGGPLGGLFAKSMSARDEIYTTVARLKRIAEARRQAAEKRGTLNAAVAGLDPTTIWDTALMLRQHGQQTKLVNALRSVGSGHMAFFPDRASWEARMREDFGDALDVLKKPQKPTKKEQAAGAKVYDTMMDRLWDEGQRDFADFFSRAARSAPELREFERFAVSNAGEAGRQWFSKTGPMFERLGVPKEDIPWLLGFMSATSTRADLHMNTNLGLEGYLAWKAGVDPAEVAKIAGGGFPSRQANVENLLTEGPWGAFGGLKTRHFQRNALGDENAVTVDVFEWRHMLGMPGDAPQGDAEYRIAEAIIRDLAYQTGINPRDRFAMNWVGLHRVGNMPFRGYGELVAQRLQIPDEVTDRVVQLFSRESGRAAEELHTAIRATLSPQELYEAGLWMRGFEGGRLKEAGKDMVRAAIEKGATTQGTELSPTELSTILAHPSLFPVKSYDFLRDSKREISINDPSGAVDAKGKPRKIKVPNPNFGKLPAGFVEGNPNPWRIGEVRGTEGIKPPWESGDWHFQRQMGEIQALVSGSRVTPAVEAKTTPKQLPGKRGRGQRGAMRPDIFGQLPVIAAGAIAKGSRRFKEWSRSALLEFGPSIRPYLSKAWQRGWDLLGGAFSSYRAAGWGAKGPHRVGANYRADVDAYAKLPSSRGGRVLDADLARELDPRYVKEPWKYAAVIHEDVAALMDRRFNDIVNEGGHGDQEFGFTGGGPGAGKTAARERLMDVQGAGYVWDGTMKTAKNAIRMMTQALAKGWYVTDSFTWRDPIASFRGALHRAMTNGRTVPVDAFVSGHIGALASAKDRLAHFMQDPRYRFSLFKVAEGPDGRPADHEEFSAGRSFIGDERMGAAEVQAQLDSLPIPDKNELRAEALRILEEEHAAGRISQDVYDGFRQGVDGAVAGGVPAPDAVLRAGRPGVQGAPPPGGAGSTAGAPKPPGGVAQDGQATGGGGPAAAAAAQAAREVAPKVGSAGAVPANSADALRTAQEASRNAGRISPLPEDTPGLPRQGEAPDDRFSPEAFERMYADRPQEARDALHQIVESNRDRIEAWTRGTQSRERARALGEQITSEVRSGPLAKGTTLNDAQLAHLGSLVGALQEKVAELSRLCATPEGASPANLLKLKLAHQELVNAVISMRGVRSEMGRGLAFMRYQMSALASHDQRMIDRALQAGISIDKVQSAMQENAGNPAAQFRALMAARRIGLGGLWRWYIVSNLLSNPQTHETNVITNLLNTVRLPVSTLAAAPFDAAVSAVTGRPRQLYAGEVSPQMVGLATSIIPAVRKSLHVLLKGYTPEGLDAGDLEMRPPEVGAGVVPDPIVGLLNAPGRVSAMADVFARTISTEQARRGHAYYLARRRVLESGSRGHTARGKIAEEYARLVAENPVDILRAAQKVGERTVFQEAAGPMIRSVKQMRDAFGPLGDVTATFIKTPLTIGKQGVQATPLGILFKQARAGDRTARQLQGEMIAGTMFTGAILAAKMHGLIEITGAGPSDPADRDTWLAAGNLPQSVRVKIPRSVQGAMGLAPSSSDEYSIPFKALGPLAVPMSAIGNLNDALEDARLRQARNPDKPVDYMARAFEVAGRVGSTMVSLGAFRNMYDFLNLIEDPEMMGKRWIQGVTNALTPAGAGLRALARYQDPVVRKPQAEGDSLYSQVSSLVKQTVQSGLPGQTQYVLPRIGNSGRVVTNKTNPLVDPDIVPINENPTRTAMAESGLRLPMQDTKQFTVNGKTYPLSPADQNVVAQARGRVLYDVAKQVTTTGAWERSSAPDRRKLIQMHASPKLDLIKWKALRYVRQGVPIPGLEALM